MWLAGSTAFSRLLNDRSTCLLIGAGLGVHGTLVANGLPSWQSPIRHGLGVPCPGCGLSRAMMAMMQGDWHQALMLHAFAPIAAITILLIFMGGLLPSAQRQSLVQGVQYLETRAGVTSLFLVGLIAYWLVRLLFFHKAFYELVM